MPKKINRQFSIFNFQFLLIWLLLIGLLVYSRFINLDWGLPFPMHPDERNMAVAIQHLECKLPLVEFNFPKSISENWEPVTNWVRVMEPFDIFSCFNPRFFAYGQFPLYIGYLFVLLMKLFDGDLATPIGLQEAIFSLRLFSAIASALTAFLMYKVFEIISRNHVHRSGGMWLMGIWGMIIFTPYAIQFSHFGTTESLLMFFYTLVVYLALLFIERKSSLLTFVINSAITVGVALATKVSSLVFAGLPLMVIAFRREKRFPGFYTLLTKAFDIFIFCLLGLLTFLLFSPHNFLNWGEFRGSMRYESDVALGNIVVFYTRQFADTTPVLFQLTKVFPYATGLWSATISALGFFLLSWKDKKINLLRLAFLVYFFSNAYFFAKWTRFMAPVFPILSIFGILFVVSVIDLILKSVKGPFMRVFVSGLVFLGLVGASIWPGVKYLKVYTNQDTRLQATKWINENIPAGSYVLSETANVVDIPVENIKNLEVVSFNFYDLDNNPFLQEELKNHLQRADYVFVPSRRIFANHPKEKYPLLNRYYSDLFSGKLGFEKVAEFSAGLNDEEAEETWSVFDHPVIRIYKKVRSF